MNLLPWSTPVVLAAGLTMIGASLVREYRTARRRDRQVHPEDVPNRYDVAAAQAIQDAEACALTQPTPAVGPAVEAIPITELEPWPVDDFAAWEKELTNR